MTLFIREDWELFRSLQTLTQKAGISRDMLGALVAKELVDNALDAVEGCDDAAVQAGFLSDDTFYVEDNGDGIDPALLAELFSIRRPLTSSKLLRLPTRGALGNGLRVVAGAVLASDGGLRVYTRGQAMQLVPQDTGETLATICDTYSGQGTRIEVQLGADLIDDNTLILAQRAILLRMGATYKGKTSPHWYDADAFYELAQAAGSMYVRDLISLFDGCTGTRAGQIAEGFQGRVCNTLSRDEAALLLLRARGAARPVKASRLGKIGDIFPDAAYAADDCLYCMENGRGSACDIPMLVEAWAFPASSAGFRVSINKTPSVVSAWAKHEKQKLLLVTNQWVIGEFPTAKTAFEVWVNIQTPYMPITSDGKAPDLTAIKDVIASTVGKAIRKAKRGVSLSPSESRVTLKDVMFNNVAQLADQASSAGRYRFSQRQLFYAMRPLLMQTFGKEPSYDTFAGYLTEYEAAYGDIPGMYRDPRGTVYHPHSGIEIPLGTLAVEAYQRPEWTFNKVLYSEKEGLFAILKAERWAEKHDCLLLTSKGQANRAAKDLIDLLGDGDEALTFFCIHDADAAGTMIYQALQGATGARAGRRVQVVNLGLEPAEARAMGLQVEDTDYKKRQPVADYVPASWAHWLQSHRVELNAMNSATFIAWLDRKFAETGLGKVKPPNGVLEDALGSQVTVKLREQVQARILQSANFEGQVERELQAVSPVVRLAAESGHLSRQIDADLRLHPVHQWNAAVDNVAAEIVDNHWSAQ